MTHSGNDDQCCKRLLGCGSIQLLFPAFLNLVRLIVFKFRRERNATSGVIATISLRKWYYRRLNNINSPEGFSSIQAAIAGKFMRALGRSCMLMRPQFDVWFKQPSVTRRMRYVCQATKVNRMTRIKRLLIKLKHLEDPGMRCFFSVVKTFSQHQMVNCRRCSDRDAHEIFNLHGGTQCCEQCRRCDASIFLPLRSSSQRRCIHWCVRHGYETMHHWISTWQAVYFP